MEIPKNLKELVNGTSNSIKFDNINSLLKRRNIIDEKTNNKLLN